MSDAHEQAQQLAAVGSGWILTYTGKKFTPCKPQSKDVVVEDIARGLSARFRYGGHTRDLYTVAEHSVIVSRYAGLCAPTPELARLWAREGLLHDGAEAYLVDMQRPVKHHPEMAGYRAIEDEVQRCVYERFGVVSTTASMAAVKDIDNRILVDEVWAICSTPEVYLGTPLLRALKPLGCQISCLAPIHAAHVFLAEFEQLFPEFCQ